MKIGVYICHCGNNIAGMVDCPGLAEWAKSHEPTFQRAVSEAGLNPYRGQQNPAEYREA